MRQLQLAVALYLAEDINAAHAGVAGPVLLSYGRHVMAGSLSKYMWLWFLLRR